MKRLLMLITTGAVVLALAATVTAITVAGGSAAGSQAAAARSTHPAPVDPDEGLAPDAPEQYLDLKESSGRAVSVAQVDRARAQAAADPAAPGTDWQFVGPTNVGGRVIDVVVDTYTPPVNGNAVVFAAVSSGGIVKSTDGGVTWTPSWPASYTQPMGALALAPPTASAPQGTLWAGTGEANPSGGGITFFGTGIYKSTDGGATWMFAGLPNSAAFGRIAVNPSNGNELWAAAAGSISQIGLPNRGLYHSVDGGATWSLSLAPVNSTTGAVDVAVDPSNPNIVWASLWDHYRNNGSHDSGGVGSGLYRSDDDGQTWTRFDNGSIVAANPPVAGGPLCRWDQPAGGGASGKGTLVSGSPTLTVTSVTSGTYTVNDRIAGTGIPAGTTIVAVSGSAPALTITMSQNATQTVTTAETVTDSLPGTGLDSDASLGRIGIAVAPTDPNRVYVEFGSPFGPDKGFYYSNNGESANPTFTCGGQAADPTGGGYEWVFGRLWVDPTNENHLFDADINLRVSTNGGLTWSNVNGPHADQHGMAWDPTVPNRVYLGDDGGMYYSTNNGTSWTHGTVEPWTQSYHLSVSQTDSKRMVTGLQDQGSIRTWQTGVEPTNLTQWNSYGGGDGHWVQIDPHNQLVYYECFQPSPPSESCERFTDAAATGSTSRATSNFAHPFPAGTTITTDTPIVLDPNDTSIVYVGGSSIARSAPGYVSLSSTSNWTLISPSTPDSAASLPGVVPLNEIDGDAYYAGEYGSVTEIAPAVNVPASATAATTVYAGTDTGKLWKTTNATATPATNVTWTQLGVGVLPSLWVSSITVDPTNANHVLVAFSGYREGNNAANVWESYDGGNTWTNISGDLPNAPVEKLVYYQKLGVLYAATDFGLFYLQNDGSNAASGSSQWVNLSTGLPNAPVFDMALSGDGTQLLVATFGRGIWELPLTSSVLSSPGGTVAGQLGLSLSSSTPSLGAFAPGVAATYSTTIAADVTTTAATTALTVADLSSPPGIAGHLYNSSGSGYSLVSPIEASGSSSAPGATGTPLTAVSQNPLTLVSYGQPVSTDSATIGFGQPIGATDPLRTGGYTKTLTFTLTTSTL